MKNLFSNEPIVKQKKDVEAYSCNRTCSGGCYTKCLGGCDGYCFGSCVNSCSTSIANLGYCGANNYPTVRR